MDEDPEQFVRDTLGENKMSLDFITEPSDEVRGAFKACIVPTYLRSIKRAADALKPKQRHMVSQTDRCVAIKGNGERCCRTGNQRPVTLYEDWEQALPPTTIEKFGEQGRICLCKQHSKLLFDDFCINYNSAQRPQSFNQTKAKEYFTNRGYRYNKHGYWLATH